MKRAHGGIQRRNSMALHREEKQSSTEAVAEVQMDNRNVSRWVGNRNNEGRCGRFVKAEESEEWMARSPV